MPTDSQVTRRTVTVEEAGRELGISRNGAYEAVRRGEIPTIKIGRRLLVPRAWLDRTLGSPDGATATRQMVG
jgi:excisionase family DNA binding protein